MLKNITFVQLAAATLACLAGVLAEMSAATAVPEEVPATIGLQYNAADLQPGASLADQQSQLSQLPVEINQEPQELEPSTNEPETGATESPSTTPRAANGFYVSLSGGLQNRQRASEVNDEDTFLTFDPGLDVNAALGYRFGNFRVEGEFSFFNNPIKLSSATVPRQFGIAPASADGNVNLRAYMANVYYDIPLRNSRLKPYVGGGIGFYQSEINGLTASFFPIANIPPVNATSDTPFAYQLRAGLSYVLSRKADVYLGYRFFRGEELEFSAAGLGTFHPNGAKVHNIELGFRASF